MAKAKAKTRKRPNKARPAVRRRRPGAIRRGATRVANGVRRTKRVSAATWRFGGFVIDKAAKRRAAHREGRDAAMGRPLGTVGAGARPNRRVDGGSAFLPSKHGTQHWYSRGIHFQPDGSIHTTPTVAFTWWGRMFAALFDRARDRFIRSAQRRVERDERLGKPRTHEQRMQRKVALRRERRAGKGTFTCRECAPPLNRFSTAAELNEHFRSAHLDDGVEAGRATGEGAARGMPSQSQPRHRRPEGGRHRTGMSGAPTRPRFYVVGDSQARADNSEQEAAAWKPHLDKIKGVVMSNGTGISSQLAEWGEHVPAGVGEMREDFAELEQIGSAFAEAVANKLQNLRMGAGALNGRPIAEVVLAALQPMQGAAEDIIKAGTAGAAAFEDEYRPDIERAKAKDRPEEEWLEKGA